MEACQFGIAYAPCKQAGEIILRHEREAGFALPERLHQQTAEQEVLRLIQDRRMNHDTLLQVVLRERVALEWVMASTLTVSAMGDIICLDFVPTTTQKG